jgi:hypothetical protein
MRFLESREADFHCGVSEPFRLVRVSGQEYGLMNNIPMDVSDHPTRIIDPWQSHLEIIVAAIPNRSLILFSL